MWPWLKPIKSFCNTKSGNMARLLWLLHVHGVATVCCVFRLCFWFHQKFEQRWILTLTSSQQQRFLVSFAPNPPLSISFMSCVNAFVVFFALEEIKRRNTHNSVEEEEEKKIKVTKTTHLAAHNRGKFRVFLFFFPLCF